MKTINKILGIGVLTLALAGCGKEYEIDGSKVETSRPFSSYYLKETKANGDIIFYPQHSGCGYVSINERYYGSRSKNADYLVFTKALERREYLWDRVMQIKNKEKHSIENAKIDLIIANIDSVRDSIALKDLEILNK